MSFDSVPTSHAPADLHEGHRPAPPAAPLLDLDRQARYLEAERAGYLVQLGELLYLAVLALYSREVRLPE